MSIAILHFWLHQLAHGENWCENEKNEGESKRKPPSSHLWLHVLHLEPSLKLRISSRWDEQQLIKWASQCLLNLKVFAKINNWLNECACFSVCLDSTWNYSFQILLAPHQKNSPYFSNSSIILNKLWKINVKINVYLRLAAVWRPSLPAQREQLASAACQHKQKPGANGNLVTEVLKQDLRPWNVNCNKKKEEITESSLDPPTIRVLTLIAA